jgi:hypothetical protein
VSNAGTSLATSQQADLFGIHEDGDATPQDPAFQMQKTTYTSHTLYIYVYTCIYTNMHMYNCVYVYIYRYILLLVIDEREERREHPQESK